MRDNLLRPPSGGWAGLGVTWDHLEAKDDGPDQPQGQSVVPVHDVM